MLRDDLVNLICGRLVRPDLASACVTEMQLQQATELEKGAQLPWFLRKDDKTSTVTIANQETYNLPSDFLRFNESGMFWYNGANLSIPGAQPWTPITRDLDYGHMVTTFTKVNALSQLNPPPTVTTAPPMAYYSEGLTFALSPIPGFAVQLRLRYYGSQPLLTSNIENAWTKYAPDLFAGQVGFILATQYVENPAKAEMFMKMKMTALDRILRDTIAMDMADLLATMGDPP
jgi:hypothetical protein